LDETLYLNKKITVKTILTIILVSIFSIGYSQELPDLKAYSKDIGFNTSFLLNGFINSSGNPFAVMLKKQKTSNSAIRFGTSLYVDISTNGSGGATYYQYDNYSISLSIGKEKQIQLTKKWIFYYGGDLAPFYQFYKQQYYQSNDLQNENQSNELGLRISPFLGIRFQINERLYVGTEALLRLSYSRNETSWRYNNGATFIETSKGFNNIAIQALPATGVFIFYRF